MSIAFPAAGKRRRAATGLLAASLLHAGAFSLFALSLQGERTKPTLEEPSGPTISVGLTPAAIGGWIWVLEGGSFGQPVPRPIELYRCETMTETHDGVLERLFSDFRDANLIRSRPL